MLDALRSLRPRRFPRLAPRARLTAVIAVVILLGFSRDAWAYVDPGTGSLAYQLLLAAILGLGFFIRRAIAAVRGTFKWFGGSGHHGDSTRVE